MPVNKKSRKWLTNAVLQNPVLVQAIGFASIIVAVTTLQGAMWISVISALHLIICEVLASAAMKRVPSWLRVAIYFALGLAIACPATYLLDKYYDLFLLGGMLASLRVFLPLMAANALTAVRCERYAILHTTRDSFYDGLSNAIGFTGVALLTGGIRELFGYGTLWGVKLSENLHIRGFWMPFGGFLLLGAMAALLKVILRALSARGIFIGADKALELAPEDRIERLVKTHQLLIADVKAAAEAQLRQAKALAAEEAAETEANETQQDEIQPEEEVETPPVPVDEMLREYGLEEEGRPQGVQPLTEEDKARLVQELENLLDDYEGGGAK